MKASGADEVQLRYEHTPTPGAPALLLINSLGASLEMWDDNAPAFSGRYELIRYDARGHGGSSVGAKAEPTMDDLAGDAIAVLDACGVARAHVCGLSLGGMTAMRLATQWPDRVLKVALCSTSPYMPPRENWDQRIQTVLAQGMAPLVETILARWFTPEFHASSPERVDRIRQMLLACDPKGYAACSAAIRDMDQRESIKGITQKTLIIAGTKDPVMSPQDAEHLASVIPDAKVATLEAMHLTNIERAEGFTNALLEFLAA